jgi:hypothetical protein
LHIDAQAARRPVRNRERRVVHLVREQSLPVLRKLEIDGFVIRLHWQVLVEPLEDDVACRWQRARIAQRSASLTPVHAATPDHASVVPVELRMRAEDLQAAGDGEADEEQVEVVADPTQ